MEELIGRQIVMSQKEWEGCDQKKLHCRAAFVVQERVVCQRCNSSFSLDEVKLPTGEYYCFVCLKYGKIKSTDYLVTSCEVLDEKKTRTVYFNWQGQLTSAQQKVANQLVYNFEQKKQTLVWAVTGSGKTEMMFLVIKRCLERGGRVCLTSPRIDVCRELFPRLNEVFQAENILLLYGGSEEKYRYCSLTICTTHQLLHFYQAFDLVIVDEIDAFPYEGDLVLRFALRQSLKQEGRLIYLTATPPNHLLKEIKEDFAIEKLPLRFHQRPLIVPETIWYEAWPNCYQKKRKMKKLLRYLRELLVDNHVLLFCPSIAYLKQLHQQLQSYFLVEELTFVFSEDKDRKTKVEKMRQKQYRILLTTTILERGVTFENISVIVMGANHPVYTKSSLVQIAGRVDRKGTFNRGRVIFFYNQKTKAIRQACQEIQAMNQLAKEWLKK